MHIAVSKAGRAESFKATEVRHTVTGFGVCPAEFRFCFGSIFLHCVPNPLFWNDNVHSVPLDVGSLEFIFYFTGINNLEIFLSLRGGFRLLNCVETVKTYGDI